MTLTHDMQQDPRYRVAQSRYLHSMYRRMQSTLSFAMVAWGIVFLVLSLAAFVDRLGSYGWGLAGDSWSFAGFALFAPVFWAFGTIILMINRAYVRHTYGPEPKEGPNNCERPDVID